MLDNINIFRMHLHQTAIFFGFFQEFDHGGVIYPEIINHKDLKTGGSIIQYGLFDFGNDLRSRIHYSRME